MRVNHSRRYLPKEQKEGFALFLSKNKGFPRKTKEQILNPVMKFLTSVFRVLYLCHLTPLFKCFSIFTYDFDFGGGFRINR